MRTLEEHAARYRAKHGDTGISSELYRAVMAGEVQFQMKKSPVSTRSLTGANRATLERGGDCNSVDSLNGSKR